MKTHFDILTGPVAVYYVLYRRKHKLHLTGLAGKHTRSTYGFLYRGYSSDCFYWEIIIMSRKMLMVIVATFGLRASVQTQGMLALLVVAVALVVHLNLRPYDEYVLDRLELYGLISSFIILYCGMFYFTDDVVIAPWFLYLVTFVILTVNALFISAFFYYLWNAIINESLLLNKFHALCCIACITKRDACIMKYFPNFFENRAAAIGRKERLNFTNANRTKVKRGSTIWSDSSDIRKKRRLERERGIHKNAVSGDKILHMAPMPLKKTFSVRQSIIKKNIQKKTLQNRRQTRKLEKVKSMVEMVRGRSVSSLYLLVSLIVCFMFYILSIFFLTGSI
jgi:hypothetical protein